jgi:hypothetical protein
MNMETLSVFQHSLIPSDYPIQELLQQGLNKNEPTGQDNVIMMRQMGGGRMYQPENQTLNQRKESFYSVNESDAALRFTMQLQQQQSYLKHHLHDKTHGDGMGGNRPQLTHSQHAIRTMHPVAENLPAPGPTYISPYLGRKLSAQTPINSTAFRLTTDKRDNSPGSVRPNQTGQDVTRLRSEAKSMQESDEYPRFKTPAPLPISQQMNRKIHSNA